MHGYGLSHSAGHMRPKKKSVNDTAKQAPNRFIHTSPENGEINENVDGGCLVGFRYKIEIPKSVDYLILKINGILLLSRRTQIHKRHCEVTASLSFSCYR